MQYTTEHAIVQYLRGVHADLEEQEPSEGSHDHHHNDKSSVDVHALVCGETGGISLGSLVLLLCPDVREVVGAAAHHLREEHDAHHEAEAQECAARVEVLVPHPSRNTSRSLSLG